MEAERAVIGSVILDPGRMADLNGLTGKDFHTAVYGVLWDRLLAMAQEGTPWDVTLIVDALKAHGEWWEEGRDPRLTEAAVSSLDLAECMQSVPVAAHAGHYGKLVSEASFRRRMIRALVALVVRCYDPTVSVERLRAMAGNLLAKIRGESG